MNWYFGGSLAQDEIVYHGKSPGEDIEDHFPHGATFKASGFPSIVPTMGFALNPSMTPLLLQKELEQFLGKNNFSYVELVASIPGWTALPPNPYVVIANIEARTPLAIVQVNQGYDGAHMMVIDGYKIYADGSIYLHFVGTENEGKSEWRRYASAYALGADVLVDMIVQSAVNLIDLADSTIKWSGGTNFYIAHYIPPLHAKGRQTDPLIYKDSDGDGIVDFDEIYRFGTDPKNPDSDGDGIWDKKEIAYYTRMGKAADIDKDGLRAELDVDSDGDGDCDGDENANKNGLQEIGETNMMDSTDLNSSRQRCKILPVALLASEQININDRAYCTDGSNYCPIVSMGLKGGNAVQLGVSAKAGSILAGSSVWLRSNASVSGNVHIAGALNSQDAVPQVGSIKQNDAEASMLVQVYRPKLLLPSFNAGTTLNDMRISSGQTVTLQPGTYKQGIVVSSGSVLRLQHGSYKMGSLTVQSGGKIELLGKDSINLDIAKSFRWDGSFHGSSIQEAASHLQVRVQGSQDIFLNTSFGGFIIAPNAYVVVGQVDKEHAGQIYAKRITIHQNTRFLWVLPGSRQTNLAAFKRGDIYAHSYK